MPLTPATVRTDLKCGRGAISSGEKCHKGVATKPGALTAGAIGLGVGLTAVGAGLYGMRRRSGGGRVTAFDPASRPSPRPGPLADTRIVPVQVRTLQPRLRGTTPKGLLPPAPPRQSKTARMRANTRASMQVAERQIAQTAREEVRRIGQIGNTMASVGEASGNITKTTLREIRLRAEAARRKFEPGYRKQRAQRDPAQLPPSTDPAFQIPAPAPEPLTPEAVLRDPRTGQPRRRRPQGFGQ